MASLRHPLYGLLVAQLAKGGCPLLALEQPWRFLRCGGRFIIVRMAHWYAVTPDYFIFHDVTRLPWPTQSGFKLAMALAKDFFPRFVVDHCVLDEKRECAIRRLREVAGRRPSGSQQLTVGCGTSPRSNGPPAQGLYTFKQAFLHLDQLTQDHPNIRGFHDRECGAPLSPRAPHRKAS